MRHFCGVKKLGPDCKFIHCLCLYLLLVSPVRSELEVHADLLELDFDRELRAIQEVKRKIKAPFPRN